MDAETIALGLGIFGIALTTLTTWLNQRERRMDHKERELDNRTTERELAKIRAVNEGQQQDLRSLNHRITTYEIGIGMLIAQLEEKGIEPRWRPSMMENSR